MWVNLVSFFLSSLDAKPLDRFQENLDKSIPHHYPSHTQKILEIRPWVLSGRGEMPKKVQKFFWNFLKILKNRFFSFLRKRKGVGSPNLWWILTSIGAICTTKKSPTEQGFGAQAKKSIFDKVHFLTFDLQYLRNPSTDLAEILICCRGIIGLLVVCQPFIFRALVFENAWADFKKFLCVGRVVVWDACVQIWLKTVKGFGVQRRKC